MGVDVKALRALMERATPRPWSAVRRSILRHVDGEPDMVATASGGSDDAAADAAFIVAAVNALPGLLDAAERAERAEARVRELEARLAAARKATDDLPRHLGATWWGQQLRAALVESTAEVSRG